MGVARDLIFGSDHSISERVDTFNVPSDVVDLTSLPLDSVPQAVLQNFLAQSLDLLVLRTSTSTATSLLGKDIRSTAARAAVARQLGVAPTGGLLLLGRIRFDLQVHLSEVLALAYNRSSLLAREERATAQRLALILLRVGNPLHLDDLRRPLSVGLSPMAVERLSLPRFATKCLLASLAAPLAPMTLHNPQTSPSAALL